MQSVHVRDVRQILFTSFIHVRALTVLNKWIISKVPPKLKEVTNAAKVFKVNHIQFFHNITWFVTMPLQSTQNNLVSKTCYKLAKFYWMCPPLAHFLSAFSLNWEDYILSTTCRYVDYKIAAGFLPPTRLATNSTETTTSVAYQSFPAEVNNQNETGVIL